MAIRFLTSQNIQAGTLTVSTIANLATASNLFLVSDGGLVKYRTAAQVRSDIGAGTGTGTTNYVSKWQDPTTLTDSIIYDDGVSVGIGTASPGEKLDVAGDILINGITIGRGSGNVSSNTTNGFEALRSNITGAQNVANGYQSLYANTTGNNNVAVGYLALRYNTTGSNNTSIGTQSLYNNVTGDSNVSNGVNSLYNNTTGNFNTGVGSEALYSNTIGFRNTAFGYQTLRTNVDDNGLTAIGYSALYSNNGGGLNTAVGYQALYSNTVANENTAVGSSALGLTVGGGRNTAVGSAAMLTNVGGSNNLALGTDALRNATANSNTAVGSYSLRTNINGSNNVAVGKDSGTFLSNGTTEVTATTNGVFIGSGTSPAANGQNNQIVIGYQAIGIGSNSVVIGNDSITKTLLKGNVGIGTTTTNYKLEVNNTSAGNLTTALTLNNGSTTTNTAVALRLQTDPTSTVNSYSEIRSTRTNSPTTGGVTMQFLNTSSTYGSASEMMRLNYLGLGIGTAGTTTITESRLGRFADGTAATPAYSFSNDINNGMYRITTDTLGFSTAGSEKLRISSAGDVGIGTSSPNQKLHVNGATQLGDINATTNFNTVALKVVEGTVSTGPTLGSGAVGAQAVLYSNGAFGMYTGVSSTGSTWMQSQRNDAGTSTYNILLNPLGGNVGIGTISPTAIGTNITTLDIKGSSGGGIRIGVGGGKESTFYTVVGGGYLGTISSIPLYFQTDNSVKATITANGSFGVGTTTPSSRFTSTTNASGPVGYTNLCAIFGDHTNTSLTYNNGVGVAGRVLTSGGKAIYGDATSGGGWGGYFDGKGYFSGYVGIGTTVATHPLDVNGIAMLRSALYMTAGGSGSTPAWYFQINGTGDLVVDEAITTQNFIFSNSGQVLIGTTVGGTPAYGSAPQFVTASTTGGVIDIRSLNTNIVANSLLGRIQFTGKDDTTVGYTTAVIEAIAFTSASTGNGGGGILKFMTSSNGTGQAPQARMWINQNGYVTIGSTNSNSYPLRVLTQVSNISIYADYDIVAFSDQSVKENIRPIENVIERVQKSRGVLYDRTDSGSKDNIGFIAQELEVAFPELVITNEDGTKAVKYQNAVAVMFEAIKEQQKQIDELKELITKLIK
jgi:hypothetical protein